MDSFLIYALIGGLGVAAIAGPLGAFVVWRRMAYFGDTLAHSALLGVALGFLLEINLNLAIIACCVGLSLLLVSLQRQHLIATDTLLGIMAHSALSLGLVAVALLEIRLDLMAYLFGDLLAIGPQQLLWIYGGGALVLLLLYKLWQPLLAITINEELAKVEGVKVGRIRLSLMLLIAMVIAIAMKIVGLLLITSLLIIPAATARRVASSPEQMAIGAAVCGCLAVTGGLLLSWYGDTPAGPSVVVIALLLFIASYLLPLRQPA
ncbi:zinc ABC transporter permease subunit ZnuB [Neptuniibacter sp. CAU 1671]|uniref:zinc ABC transporter permease subunit ZnuB n=1 Tax=Neptuniibacter sp. CAU 1671 TaxID=3032593 RepID=UPI0023DA6CAA|nr:zinc ABC transporter permease subunit ZnuB [Neptuniibacter sp. CAU 1671]MDF2182478.1 zinc ABC transporter permease subunit ZnuB [Neptuniibacter sp. CAU 1671]